MAAHLRDVSLPIYVKKGETLLLGIKRRNNNDIDGKAERSSDEHYVSSAKWIDRNLDENQNHLNKLFTSNAMSQVRMEDDIFFLFLIKVHQNQCVDLFRQHLNDNLVSNVLFAAINIKSPQILSSLISINNGGIISILEPLTFQKLQRLDF
eukprot:UN11729